ncbi:MAG: glycosyltransferase family 2 protein [Candidatus Liptonbacteria bacterium]|nr:glycosyltransferase family 2 protein [Candidatus Liptonbacteria bacterium]
MTNPQVSILLATWNRAKKLGPAIESVRMQSFGDWELIIADDGSTDETPIVVREWQKREPRIVYVRSETNDGISKNYNKGLNVAKGEYVAMIDDDDAWIGKDKLKRQIDFLEKNPEYVGCGGGVVVVNEAGKELYRYLKPETDKEIRERMLFGNPIANSTTVFRRAVGEQVGRYDETTRYSGDRDFWLKMGLVGKLYNFPEYFSYYTMSNVNTSIAKIKPHLKASLVVMKRYRKSYPHYLPALALNELQYCYAFLPGWIKKAIHFPLARLKRLLVG